MRERRQGTNLSVKGSSRGPASFEATKATVADVSANRTLPHRILVGLQDILSIPAHARSVNIKKAGNPWVFVEKSSDCLLHAHTQHPRIIHPKKVTSPLTEVSNFGVIPHVETIATKLAMERLTVAA